MTDLAKIHAEARAEFTATESALSDERKLCVEDRGFYSIAGAMWLGKWGQQFENKPKLEINRVMLAVMRIINEYRANRITVDYVSKGDEPDDDLAELCDGLYRADEQDSSAEEAYDNAFEEGVGGGFAAWRLRAEYEDEYDEENTRQRIRIEPIFDADSSVYFDLNAKKQDKSDAKKCWVVTPYTHDAYKAEFDDDPSDWPKGINVEGQFAWSTPDVVYVAEYYVVEEVSEEIEYWTRLDGEDERHWASEFTDEDGKDNGLRGTLKAKGHKLTNTRKIKRRKVRKYIMSGSKILEDCGYIAGSHIPIVPYYAKRWYYQNLERCMGHVRLTKDPSRLYNMQTSKLAELAATTSSEKPIFTGDQMAGHEKQWSEDAVKNYNYLLVNPVLNPDGSETPMGPLGYTKPPDVPPTLAALVQIAQGDLADILGNQDQGEEMLANQAGIAVEKIQTRLDMQTEIYMTNFAKAMKRSGEIWLSMATDIFVEEGRRMKVVGPDGSVESAVLMGEKVQNKNTGEIYTKNDLSRAKFDVVSNVGPSSSSKRDATVRKLTAMLQVTTDPETHAIISCLILMNMEGEGVSEMQSYARQKLIGLGVIQPTDAEKKDLEAEMQNQPPDANAALLMAEAEKSTVEAQKVAAEIDETIADTARKEAETAQIIAETKQLGVTDPKEVEAFFSNLPGQRPTAQPQ